MFLKFLKLPFNLQFFADTFGEAAQQAAEFFNSEDNSPSDSDNSNVDIDGTDSSTPNGTGGPQEETQTGESSPDISTLLKEMQENILSTLKNQSVSADIEDTKEQDESTKEEAQEETQDDPDELFNQLAANPKEFVAKIAEKIYNEVSQKKEAELKEQFEYQQKWDDIAARFREAHPDYHEVYNDMKQLLETDSSIRYKVVQDGKGALTIVDNEDAFELAYNKVKSQKEAGKPKTLEEMLNDDSYIEKIIGNEKVSKKVIESYLKQVGTKTKPVVIGSGGSGNPVLGQKQELNSFTAAKKAFLSSIK